MFSRKYGTVKNPLLCASFEAAHSTAAMNEPKNDFVNAFQTRCRWKLKITFVALPLTCRFWKAKALSWSVIESFL